MPDAVVLLSSEHVGAGSVRDPTFPGEWYDFCSSGIDPVRTTRFRARLPIPDGLAPLSNQVSADVMSHVRLGVVHFASGHGQGA